MAVLRPVKPLELRFRRGPDSEVETITVRSWGQFATKTRTVPDTSYLPPIDGYQVTGFIDRGGMGRVFEARSLRDNRIVAIKIPNHVYIDQERHARRFQREIEGMMLAHTRRSVDIIDYGSGVDGTAYIVMEFLYGTSLGALYENYPVTLTSDGLRAFAYESAHALADLHRNGLVHRDIKPSNIMLTDLGLKLVDFGLVTSDEYTTTSTGINMGSLGYMAPERIDKPQRRHDYANVDLFSWGATMFFAATGEHPFSPMKPANAKLVAQQQRVISKRLGKPLGSTVAQCLSWSPADRPEDASELVRRFLTTSPPGWPKFTATQWLQRSGRMKP